MGANMSRSFDTAAEADRWAAQQSKLAAQWNLQVTVDLGNTAVLRVPVIKSDGTPSELAVALEPAQTVEKRVAELLSRTGRHRGYREDRRRRRTQAVIRSLRFD
jgi:hypothetical protein